MVIAELRISSLQLLQTALPVGLDHPVLRERVCGSPRASAHAENLNGPKQIQISV